jgi:hypothetical protein
MWLQRCAVASAAVVFLACTAATEAGLKIERFDRQVWQRMVCSISGIQRAVRCKCRSEHGDDCYVLTT